MEPETQTTCAQEPSVEEVEATLRDVRAFLDNPVALLERTLELLQTPKRMMLRYADSNRGRGVSLPD